MLGGSGRRRRRGWWWSLLVRIEKGIEFVVVMLSRRTDENQLKI